MEPRSLTPDLQLAREIVFRHFAAQQARVILFGSRARGDARRWSDIDLAIAPKVALPEDSFAALREALAESNMLLNVDLVDLRDASPALCAAVAHEGVPWID